MSNPAVSAVAADSRLAELATTSLASTAIPFRATLFDKSGTTNWLISWHQDTALPLIERCDMAAWGSWSQKGGAIYAHAPAWALARIVALRVHLDASDADNGPLRVIPGSHRGGVLSDSAVMEVVAANNQVECCVPEGGVLAMRPLLVHSSSKVRSAKSRRVLHIEYADSLELAEGIQLAVV